MRENTLNVKSVKELREIIRNGTGEGKLLTITIDTEPQSEGNGSSSRSAVMDADGHEEQNGEVVYGGEQLLDVGGFTSNSDNSCEGVSFEHKILEGVRSDG